MLIKVLILAFVAVLTVVALRAPAGARRTAMRRVGMIVFSTAAALSVLFPEAWTAAARFVGVGRGTDLLLYGLVLAFLGYVATSYHRTRALEAQITRLARRIALDEAGVPALPERRDS